MSGSEMCDGILFIVSFGGGTGTGFVNPITRYIRGERPAYPVFVLGVLTEEGTDPQQRAKEAKRDLGATISLYDLLTKKVGVGVDGVILADNQILVERFGQDYSAIDDFIHQSMILAGRHYPGEDPPSLAMREKFIEGLDRPPHPRPLLLPRSEAEGPPKAISSERPSLRGSSSDAIRGGLRGLTSSPEVS